MGILIIIGSCGNFLAFVVLIKPIMRHQAFNLLLASLCIVDITVIFSNAFSCARALQIVQYIEEKNRKIKIHILPHYYIT